MTPVTVVVYRPDNGPPCVCADEQEAREFGIFSEPEAVPIGMAVALSVGEHHDWKARARSLARIFVAKETGRTRVRFSGDPPETSGDHLPFSVMLPEELGGEEARVICAHEGQCACGGKHKTRWLDVAGGFMVTVCSESRRVIWVQRGREPF